MTFKNMERWTNFSKAIGDMSISYAKVQHVEYTIIGSTYEGNCTDEEKTKIEDIIKRLKEIQKKIRDVENDMIRLDTTVFGA